MSLAGLDCPAQYLIRFGVQPMRLLLISASCIGLIACGQTSPGATTERISNYFSGLFNKQAQEEAEQRCAKVTDLRIGMSTQEVVNACGRSALQVTDAVTADGNQQTWHYRDTYLIFANGKLAHIQREQ
jgi:hypothetical protein